MRIKNIKQRIFIIYTLKDPETLEIRYVGVTCTNLGARLSQHIYDSKRKGDSHKKRWIRSLKTKPLIEKIEECNCKNWGEREKYWISYYKNLTNTEEGGQGVVLNRSEDSVKRSSEAKYKALVAIDSNRKIHYFESHVEASKVLKVPKTSIEYSISNLNYSSYGYNFIHLTEFTVGMEKTVKISKKKQKFNIKYQGKIFTILKLAEHLKINETTVYLWCSGHTNWKKAHKLKGEQIEIFKI
jgi:hypothetical protein